MEPMPFSQACENNKWPILHILRRIFTDPALILEIGSGTGQHAEFFPQELPHLQWQPTDRPGEHEICKPRLDQAQLANTNEPRALDVLSTPWSVSHADGVFSANTLHIMGWAGVDALFAGVAELLATGHHFCVYGPFNQQGRFTSESNARFHEQLKGRDPAMGLRDVDDLRTLGAHVALELVEQCPMPANNQLLVWERI